MRVFEVGEWTVDPQRDRIERGGEERRLTPRVMNLLVYLAERPGEVLSGDLIRRDVPVLLRRVPIASDSP